MLSGSLGQSPSLPLPSLSCGAGPGQVPRGTPAQARARPASRRRPEVAARGFPWDPRCWWWLWLLPRPSYGQRPWPGPQTPSGDFHDASFWGPFLKPGENPHHCRSWWARREHTLCSHAEVTPAQSRRCLTHP